MAADPVAAVALVGLGVHELSMDPWAFGRVKRAVARVTMAQARRVAQAACDAASAEEARRIVGAAATA
jgi:signal transduction protein with GAF and PtsI domain